MRDLTKGAPLKVILAFYLPVMLGGLFQQFYIIADTAIVGQFIGTEALAAIGAGGPLGFFFLAFGWGLTAGFCVPIARSFGAGDMRALRGYLAGTIQLAVGFTVLLTVLTTLLAGPILRAMNTPEDIFVLAYRYIIVHFAGTGAFMLYSTLNGVARAVGDSRTPLYVLIVSSVLNIGLDLLFILGFGWGMLGVGLASVLAQLCAGLACFIYMRKKYPELKVHKNEWKLIFCPGSGGFLPRNGIGGPSDDEAIKLGLPDFQLYNTENDPGEQNNMYRRYPDVTEELRSILDDQISAGRSTPGTPQKNDLECIRVEI